MTILHIFPNNMGILHIFPNNMGILHIFPYIWVYFAYFLIWVYQARSQGGHRGILHIIRKPRGGGIGRGSRMAEN